jgi:TRAP-type C4-dicarboxylate transport system permease small subunit
MWLLRLLNTALLKLAYATAMMIVALMVMALSLSAITRFFSGTGYDWLIELPPVLVCWLVFPLLGPLLKEGRHIQVDFLSSVLSGRQAYLLKIFINVTALVAALIFFKAGLEATQLYFRMGQMMELEIDLPIWWMYLSFPVGFAIMAFFAIELLVDAVTCKDSEERNTQ